MVSYNHVSQIPSPEVIPYHLLLVPKTPFLPVPTTPISHHLETAMTYIPNSALKLLSYTVIPMKYMNLNLNLIGFEHMDASIYPSDHKAHP